MQKLILKGSGIVGHYQTGVLVDNSTSVDITSLNFAANEISILVKISSYITIDDDNLYTNTAGVKFYNVENSSISKNYFESKMIFLLYHYLNQKATH